MVEVIKSSFIPKKEMKKKVVKRSGGGINIFFLISLIIFLSTMVGAMGVYFWKASLNKEIEQNKAAFEKNKESYGIKGFQDSINFDKRIRVGRQLLKNHYYIIPIFEFLERRTVPDIVYTDMDLKENGDYIELNFKGNALKFYNLVQQNSLYTDKYPNIENFMFTNITTSKEDRKKIFDMSFRINKKYLTVKPLSENN